MPQHRVGSGTADGGTPGSIPSGTPFTGGAAYAVLREDGSQNIVADTSLTFSGASAGTGLKVVAGTNAAAATTYALEITQTLNNASALGGIRFAQTQTSASASALLLELLGGAAGATQRFAVTNAGIAAASTSFRVGTAAVPVMVMSVSTGSDYATVSGGQYGFSSSSTNAGTAADTVWSRISANVSAFGSSAGNSSGTVNLATLVASSTIRGGTFTVATLPAAGLVGGMRAFVSDATANVYGAAPVGGAATSVPVYYSSSAAAWLTG